MFSLLARHVRNLVITDRPILDLPSLPALIRQRYYETADQRHLEKLLQVPWFAEDYKRVCGKELIDNLTVRFADNSYHCSTTDSGVPVIITDVRKVRCYSLIIHGDHPPPPKLCNTLSVITTRMLVAVCDILREPASSNMLHESLIGLLVTGDFPQSWVFKKLPNLRYFELVSDCFISASNIETLADLCPDISVFKISGCHVDQDFDWTTLRLLKTMWRCDVDSGKLTIHVRFGGEVIDVKALKKRVAKKFSSIGLGRSRCALNIVISDAYRRAIYVRHRH